MTLLERLMRDEAKLGKLDAIAGKRLASVTTERFKKEVGDEWVEIEPIEGGHEVWCYFVSRNDANAFSKALRAAWKKIATPYKDHGAMVYLDTAGERELYAHNPYQSSTPISDHQCYACVKFRLIDLRRSDDTAFARLVYETLRAGDERRWPTLCRADLATLRAEMAAHKIRAKQPPVSEAQPDAHAGGAETGVVMYFEADNPWESAVVAIGGPGGLTRGADGAWSLGPRFRVLPAFGGILSTKPRDVTFWDRGAPFA